MNLQFIGLDDGLLREADAQAIAYVSKVRLYFIPFHDSLFDLTSF